MKKLWRTTFAPTRRLAVLLAVLAPVWMLSSTRTGLMICAALTVGVLLAAVCDAVFTPSRGQLTVTRIAPVSTGAGDLTDASYGIRSAWPRRLRLTLHDALPVPLGRERADSGAIVIEANGSATIPFRMTPLERGSHAMGPVALRVYGALGLAIRTLRFGMDDVILVTPSLVGVRRYRLLALQHRLRDAGVRSLRLRGLGTTFSNLREYAQGDDPRHIDWKATARHDKLVSREFTIEQGQTIIIAIDAGRMMTQLSDGLPRFEYALSSALVLADVAVHSQDHVGLIVFDDAVRAFVPPERGNKALAGIRAALVTAQTSMVEPDYAMAFRTIETRHRKRSLIVLFTDVIDSRSSQAILAHTARSAARHLPLVVALRNDELIAAADPAGKDSSSALYTSAAAEELVSAREEALVRMRRSGVSVLDTSPHAMAAGVVNRYLELKSRASL